MYDETPNSEDIKPSMSRKTLKSGTFHSIHHDKEISTPYVVVPDASDTSDFARILLQWNLGDHKLLFVVVENEHDDVGLLDLLLQTADTAKVLDQMIALVVLGSLGWPGDSCALKKPQLYNNIPLIRVYFNIFTGLEGDVDLTSFSLNSISSVFSHHLIIDTDDFDCLSKFRKTLKCFNVAIMHRNLDNVPGFFAKHIFDNSLFSDVLVLSGEADRRRHTMEPIPTHIDSLTPDTILLKLLQSGTSPGGKLLHEYTRGHIKSLGTICSEPLISESLTSKAPMVTLKKYCVLEFKNDSEFSIPWFVCKNLPEYDLVICLSYARQKSGMIRTVSDYNLYTTSIVTGFDALSCAAESEKLLFVIFDPQGFLFRSCTGACSIGLSHNSNKSHCIAVIPLGALRNQMQGVRWRPDNGKIQEFPLNDRNSCIDSYIFLDENDTKNQMNSFSNVFMKSVEAQLLAHADKRRKSIWMHFDEAIDTRVFLKTEQLNDDGLHFNVRSVDHVNTLVFITHILSTHAKTSPAVGYQSMNLRPSKVLQDITCMTFSLSEIKEPVPGTVSWICNVALALSRQILLSQSKPDLMFLYGAVCYVLRFISKQVIDFDFKTNPLIHKEYKEALMEISCIFAGPAVGYLEHPQVKYEAPDETPELKQDDKEKEPEAMKEPLEEIVPLQPVTDLFALAVTKGNYIAVEAILPYTRCEDLLANALYAVGVFQYAIRKTPPHFEPKPLESFYSNLMNTADSLETQAKEIVSILHGRDKTMSAYALFRPVLRFGDVSSFHLAYLAGARKFLSDEAADAAINKDWWGPLARVQGIRRILYAFIPWLDSSLVEKVKKNAVEPEPTSEANIKASTCSVNNPKADTMSTHAKYINIAAKNAVESHKKMYQEPGVKFIFHITFYYAFLAMYSKMVLHGIRLTPTFLEFVILFWMLGQIVDEFQELTDGLGLRQDVGIWKKLKVHFHRFWNIIDALIYILYTVAFILRCIAAFARSLDTLHVSHIFFAFDILLVYCRSLQFYSRHNEIGPLMITIGYMSSATASFLVILFTIMLGYGFALHTLLSAGTRGDIIAIPNGILYIPYFQLYGDLHLDEILYGVYYNTTGVESAVTPFNNQVGIALAAAYFLFVIILLLNLLIALLNSSYGKVESDSQFHSIMHKIDTIMEYKSKSTLPPPLNFLSYLVYLPFKSSSKKTEKKETSLDIPEQLQQLLEEYFRDRKLDFEDADTVVDSAMSHVGIKRQLDSITDQLFALQVEQAKLSRNALHMEDVKNYK